MRVEGEYGKTEMWYVVDADPGATLLYGFKHEISKDEFARRIADNTLLEVTNAVPVKKGDVFFIQAGTLHAIGKGILIAEIQQNSNTTYRVYDYDRRDKNGNPRELHIDKAIEVSRLTPSPEIKKADRTAKDAMLASCDKFTVRRLLVDAPMTVTIGEDCFHSLIVTEGSGTLEMNGAEYSLEKGDSIFIPAQNSDYTLKGNCCVILSYV